MLDDPVLQNTDVCPGVSFYDMGSSELQIYDAVKAPKKIKKKKKKATNAIRKLQVS